MKKIRFTGWNKNMNKIKFIHLLNEQAGLSLKESKEIKDRIVDGEVIEIEVHDDKVKVIISEATAFGVIAEEDI